MATRKLPRRKANLSPPAAAEPLPAPKLESLVSMFHARFCSLSCAVRVMEAYEQDQVDEDEFSRALIVAREAVDTFDMVRQELEVVSGRVSAAVKLARDIQVQS